MANDLKHIGNNLRNIRLLKGVKQEVLARRLGIAQQNVSKMEKKDKISQKKLEAAAKVLGVTVETIKDFNEKAVFNSNIAFEENSGQVNNINPVQEIIAYFKEELAKKDNEIKKLLAKVEAYEKGNGRKQKGAKNAEISKGKSDGTTMTAIR